jgi:3-deoxy-7-phosphoheptulonate synthase
MRYDTDDIRIDRIRPLIPPAILMEELPVSALASQTVARAREVIGQILRGDDDRLLVVVGPCSIHDPRAAKEYAARLQQIVGELSDALFIVMRVYFEKPRTTVGWKGLINDPNLDGRFAINQGLRAARELLLHVADLGLPTGTEFLDTITPQFIADLVSWGAIGARTTESQIHRELASGLSMPVGFKNGTYGGVQIAVDAVSAAGHPHHFLSVTKQGIAAIVATRGNPSCHVVLRGSNTGPNHDAAAIRETSAALEKAGLPARILVDCSHGNSRKNHRNQPTVARDVGAQIAAGECAIFGVMLESHLVEGRQDHVADRPLTYGQSITDACLGWDDTVAVLHELAESARARRCA